MCHVSPVTCHVSCVMCHVSRVMCQVSRVKKNLPMSRIKKENKETQDARKELDRYMGTLGSLFAKTATMKVVSDFTELTFLLVTMKIMTR